MKLILHHLAKDIRAQRWLLALWAFFLLLYVAAYLLIIQPDYDVAHSGEILLALPPLSLGSIVVWVLLLVAVIQSESIVGSTSFWLTRPVPRSILIPSKLTFIVLFLLLPWLALTPCEMLLLRADPALLGPALSSVWLTLGLSLVVIWIATFTRTLGGFFAAGVVIIPALLGVFGLRLIYRLNHSSAADYGLEVTQFSLVIFILMSGLAVSILVQHLVRKTLMGIRIAIGSLVLALLVGFFWPVALPNSLTLLGFMPSSWTSSVAEKNVQVSFVPTWPASVTWSQPSQPNGGGSTVAVGNGVVMHVATAKPISTTDDEGNPVIIGALVATAILTPAAPSTAEFPMIEGVEASFKLPDGSTRQLPRRDYDTSRDKSDQFDLVGAVKSDLPGATLTAPGRDGFALAPTPLFKLDAGNLDQLRGKTGELTLRLYGHMQTLSRQAAVPLEGNAFSRIPNGVIHARLAMQQTQSIFGIDLPIVTKDKPMLAVWQVSYQPALSRLNSENYYILVDTTTHAGVILPIASTFARRVAGSVSMRTNWTEYLTLPPGVSSEGALAHKVLYIYTSTPTSIFTATLTAPNFTMNPPP